MPFLIHWGSRTRYHVFQWFNYCIHFYWIIGQCRSSVQNILSNVSIWDAIISKQSLYIYLYLCENGFMNRATNPYQLNVSTYQLNVYRVVQKNDKHMFQQP